MPLAKPKLPRPVVVDFETFGIEGRPHYPPVPVGVSIKWPDEKKPHYYAWGHLSGNNCSWGEAQEALAQAWAHGEKHDGLLFQNGKFDVDVAEVHMDMPRLDWSKYHDTLYLLFLDDPHQLELGLKPSAERLLGMPPEEQDEVADWLILNQPIPGVRITRGRQGEHYAGKYIAYAPGGLVGEYANGDVVRTEKLFKLLWPKTAKRDMLRAYDRERELMPILLEVERQGIRVDLAKLRADVAAYGEWREKLNQWIIKTIRAPADINLDSGDQLVKAMVEAGKVDVDLLGTTATGKYQTNKESLMAAVSDKQLLGVLKYRTQLNTCLNTFMAPWLRVAEQSGGLIFTTWNQTKSTESGGAVGTRTGRLSSTPNFQNIPKTFEAIFIDDVEVHLRRKSKLPKCPLKGLPPLPNIRGYIVPYEKDHVLIDRDYCFSPDTEVLTEDGFVRFDQLQPGAKVAQWARGLVSYATPLEYQRTTFKGNLINVIGSRSTDLLVTPNHMCVLAKDHQLVRIRADEYPTGAYQQLHAGVLPGLFLLPDGAPSLLAAIQADATVKSSSLAWKLKKARKVARLHGLLTKLRLPYTVSTPPSAPGYSITYVKLIDLPGWASDLLGPSYKIFARDLINLMAPQRLEFLRELAHWDGRRVGDGLSNWSYFTTVTHNAEVVQELAALTGLRSTKSVKTLPSGRVFTTVTLRTNYATWTQTFRKVEVPYEGHVYCVTMPAGTVIVRRNGKVSMTGQSQQEPRILAHFDGGALMQKYLDNPWIDFHDSAQEELAKVGKIYDRKPVKNTNLGLIYGMGNGKLAAKNNMTVEESAELKKAILNLYPGLKDMYGEMRRRAKANEPIRTWGGREYYCEPPRLIDGRIRTFDYKLVNVLVQGSAADCTKEAIIRYWKLKGPEDRLLLNVHDQLTASTPRKRSKVAMELLRQAMESVEFDVPILSEGAISETNWAELRNYDKKGQLVKP